MAALINSGDSRLFSVLPTLSYQLYDHSHAQRNLAEQAVKRIFRSVYNADIGDFAPLLITAEKNDYIEAVIGLRDAGQSRLFLEQYLPQPIETVLAEQHGITVQRDRLIEIGNLVSARSGSSRQLFIMLALALYEAGVEWVAFTATKQVEGLLQRFGWTPIAICQAQCQAVVNGQSTWGSYYEVPPTVCFGNVKEAIGTLLAQPTVSAIYPMLEPQVRLLAEQIKQGFDHA